VAGGETLVGGWTAELAIEHEQFVQQRQESKCHLP
jgi:hypothetical protein